MDRKIIGSIILGAASIAFTVYCFKKADKQIEEMQNKVSFGDDDMNKALDSSVKVLMEMKEKQEAFARKLQASNKTQMYQINLQEKNTENNYQSEIDELTKEVRRLKTKGFSDKDIIRILRLDSRSYDYLSRRSLFS